MARMAGIAFGSEMRKEFMMSPDVTPMNHGSWGACPRRVFDARIDLLKEVESAVDIYHRYHWENYWFDNLKAVCEFLNLEFKNTTFVPNATTGINTILKSLPLKEGDEIFVNTFTYNAIKKATESAAFISGAKAVLMDMSYVIKSREEFIQNFTKSLDQHPNVKVAIIDYISSPTATVFPVKELCAVCRERNVISVIDGAHAPGQVKLDMDKIKPDFFVGNLHKWVYCPRGTAVLWIHPKFQDVVRPLVTSHYYKMEPFQKDYFYQATIDNTNYNVTKVAVQFYKDIGGIEAVQKYVTNMLDEAVEYLVKLWGTDKLPIPRDMEAPYMRLVRMPPIPKFPIPERNKTTQFGDHQPLMAHFIKERKMFTVFLVIKSPDGSFNTFLRLSGQIYTTLDDFKKVGEEMAVADNVELEEFLTREINVAVKLLTYINEDKTFDSWIRLSCNIYNTTEDFHKLGNLIQTMREN